MKIRVNYRSVDGYYRGASFATLEGARRFAARWVGENPDVSTTFGYAVSDDGVGKVTVSGDATILDLFPVDPPEPEGVMVDEDGLPLDGPAYADYPDPPWARLRSPEEAMREELEAEANAEPNEFRAAFVEGSRRSRMREHERLLEIEALRRAGKYVVVEYVPDHCSITDAVIGSATWMRFSGTEAEARAFEAKEAHDSLDGPLEILGPLEEEVNDEEGAELR